MLNLIRTLLFAGLAFFRTRRQLALEILALRHQLGVLKRSVKRPRLANVDRGLWVLLSRRWTNWSGALIFVKPATVISWHRAGYRRYWTWRSRPKDGRPALDPRVRKLIRRMATANLWGAPRIHGELLKLGIEISEATVSKYMLRRKKPPSQTWRSFLENHLDTLVSVDFFVVPTVFFHVLFVFVVLAHDRRRILSINVTSNPSAAWTANQIVQAFPCESAPRYLLRGRVERWRGGCRSWGVAVAGGFRLYAGASVHVMTPFPAPSRRTVRADFPHTALTRNHHAFALSRSRFGTCGR